MSHSSARFVRDDCFIPRSCADHTSDHLQPWQANEGHSGGDCAPFAICNRGRPRCNVPLCNVPLLTETSAARSIPFQRIPEAQSVIRSSKGSLRVGSCAENEVMKSKARIAKVVFIV